MTMEIAKAFIHCCHGEASSPVHCG